MATGTHPTVSAPVFHADDPEQTTEYRSLSLLAILALVFGVAAPLAIFGPVLMVVPIFGIAIALLALRSIAISDGAMTGRWAAMTGLVLSCASLVFPVSHDWIQRSIREREADAFNRRWLTLMTAGQTQAGFKMTVDGSRPQQTSAPKTPPGGGPGMDAPPTPKQTPYEAFMSQPFVNGLKSVGENADIRLKETVEFKPNTYRNIEVRQRYTITPAKGGAGKAIDYVVTVQRAQMPGESMSRWLITRCDPPEQAK